jgi:hypothetical protein
MTEATDHLPHEPEIVHNQEDNHARLDWVWNLRRSVMPTLPKSREAHPEASVNRQGMPPHALLRITGQDEKPCTTKRPCTVVAVKCREVTF